MYCLCISGVCLSYLYDIYERQLHNNNARGINIQLHAHQLHNNNRWGVNCAILPAPMVLRRCGIWSCTSAERSWHGVLKFLTKSALQRSAIVGALFCRSSNLRELLAKSPTLKRLQKDRICHYRASAGWTRTTKRSKSQVANSNQFKTNIVVPTPPPRGSYDLRI